MVEELKQDNAPAEGKAMFQIGAPVMEIPFGAKEESLYINNFHIMELGGFIRLGLAETIPRDPIKDARGNMIAQPPYTICRRVILVPKNGIEALAEALLAKARGASDEQIAAKPNGAGEPPAAA